VRYGDEHRLPLTYAAARENATFGGLRAPRNPRYLQEEVARFRRPLLYSRPRASAPIQSVRPGSAAKRFEVLDVFAGWTCL
jgi:hypothetical protein